MEKFPKSALTLIRQEDLSKEWSINNNWQKVYRWNHSMTPADNYQFDTSISIVVQIYETLSSRRHYMEIKIIYNNINRKSIQ